MSTNRPASMPAPAAWWRRIVDQHLIWVLLAALMVVGLFLPGFWGLTNLVNIAWSAAPLGLMVLGMHFVVLTGGVDLSLESSFALVPTLVVIALVNLWPAFPWPWAGLLAVPVIGAAIGYFNGLFSVRLGVDSFLVTLATLLVMRGLVIYLIPEGVYYLPGALTFLGQHKLFEVFPVAILVWLALYALAYAVLTHHRLGKDIFAVGNNREAAFLAGVPVQRTQILCFMIAGVVAAIGGLIEVGRLASVAADMGNGSVLMVFAGTVLGGTALSGGVGRVGGILAAVLVIALIENLMNLFGVEPSIRQMVFGSILLASMVLASLQGRLRTQA